MGKCDDLVFSGKVKNESKNSHGHTDRYTGERRASEQQGQGCSPDSITHVACLKLIRACVFEANRRQHLDNGRRMDVMRLLVRRVARVNSRPRLAGIEFETATAKRHSRAQGINNKAFSESVPELTNSIEHLLSDPIAPLLASEQLEGIARRSVTPVRDVKMATVVLDPQGESQAIGFTGWKGLDCEHWAVAGFPLFLAWLALILLWLLFTHRLRRLNITFGRKPL